MPFLSFLQYEIRCISLLAARHQVLFFLNHDSNQPQRDSVNRALCASKMVEKMKSDCLTVTVCEISRFVRLSDFGKPNDLLTEEAQGRHRAKHRLKKVIEWFLGKTELFHRTETQSATCGLMRPN
jgi:hypothetical protein